MQPRELAQARAAVIANCQAVRADSRDDDVRQIGGVGAAMI